MPRVNIMRKTYKCTLSGYNVYKLTPTYTYILGPFSYSIDLDLMTTVVTTDYSCQFHRGNYLVVDVQIHYGNTTWQQNRK